MSRFNSTCQLKVDKQRGVGGKRKFRKVCFYFFNFITFPLVDVVFVGKIKFRFGVMMRLKN